LIGYDPVVELSQDHLCRFVDTVVDDFVKVPSKSGPGQPAYDPRVPVKVLLYGMATGVRSSRRLAQNCHESLPYLLLVRDDRPCYRTLCTARCECEQLMEQIWVRLSEVASECGMGHLGKVAIDSTKLRADASRDSVVRAKHMDSVICKFRQMIEEMKSTDATEDQEGSELQTQTGVPVSQMREVLRRIRRQDPESMEISERLRPRLEEGLRTLEAAKEAGLKQVSLSDPDARMMPIGSSRKIAMGYSLEAASDGGLLVVGQVHSGCTDNDRLVAVLSEAEKMETAPVSQVVADSGYYAGGLVNELLQRDGLEVVVPDSLTAGKMRKPDALKPEPEGPIEFKRHESQDAYVCPMGKLLKPEDRQRRGGQLFVTYVAQGSCLECPLAARCLKSPTAKRRNLSVGEFDERLKAHLARFEDPEFRRAYHARGPNIETVFAHMRRVMGFDRWSVRGLKKVQAEASILKTAYQIRKIQSAKMALKAA
jgi:transposase